MISTIGAVVYSHSWLTNRLEASYVTVCATQKADKMARQLPK